MPTKKKNLFLADQAPSLQPIAPIPVEPILNTVEPPVTPPVVVADAKRPFESKIVLLNVVVALVSILELFSAVEVLALFIADPATRDQVAAYIVSIGLPLANIILRVFFTYKPTTLTTTK